LKIEILNGKRLVNSADNAQNMSAQWVDFDRIEIQDGVIYSIDQSHPDFKADISFDGAGCYILPGLIDLNVSLREPGYTAKGSIYSETKAAAAGGVTTLCCTPETKPINDSKAVSKLIEELAQEAANCEVLPLGALTQGLQGEQLSEYASLKNAHCIALSNGYHPIKNLAITKRCFEYAKTHNLSVFINAIEDSLHKGVMHEDEISTTIGLQGIPDLAETVAVSQLIKLAEATGVHLHLSQLSTADAVAQVKAAKVKGLRITADVAIQNLLYTDEKVANFSSVFHCMPPLRSEADRLALLEGVKSRVITAITSAHQPHEAAAKQMPFAETEVGMSSIEFLLPMAMKLELEHNLPLTDFIFAMTQGAAQVLNLPIPQVVEGQKANLCIFDPDISYVLEQANILSMGKNTPLIGQTLTGCLKATIFEGRVSYSV